MISEEDVRKLPATGPAAGPRSAPEAWRSERERMLADLAQTVALLEASSRVEMGIAATLGAMAGRDGSGLAARRRQLAAEALAGAQRARDRAQALRRLAAAASATTVMSARCEHGGALDEIP